jgi:hypothetical protein
MNQSLSEQIDQLFDSNRDLTNKKFYPNTEIRCEVFRTDSPTYSCLFLSEEKVPKIQESSNRFRIQRIPHTHRLNCTDRFKVQRIPNSNHFQGSNRFRAQYIPHTEVS